MDENLVSEPSNTKKDEFELPKLNLPSFSTSDRLLREILERLESIDKNVKEINAKLK